MQCSALLSLAAISFNLAALAAHLDVAQVTETQAREAGGQRDHCRLWVAYWSAVELEGQLQPLQQRDTAQCERCSSAGRHAHHTQTQRRQVCEQGSRGEQLLWHP